MTQKNEQKIINFRLIEYTRFSDRHRLFGDLSPLQLGFMQILETAYLQYYPAGLSKNNVYRTAKATNPREKSVVRELLDKFFVLVGDCYQSERLNLEAKATISYSEKQAAKRLVKTVDAKIVTIERDDFKNDSAPQKAANPLTNNDSQITTVKPLLNSGLTTLNKKEDIINTITPTSTSTLREDYASSAVNYNLDAIQKDKAKIIAALEQAEPALLLKSLALIEAWLADGADADRDIIPTIQRICAEKPNQIKGLAYFTNAIAQSKAERASKLPIINQQKEKNHGKSECYNFSKVKTARQRLDADLSRLAFGEGDFIPKIQDVSPLQHNQPV